MTSPVELMRCPTWNCRVDTFRGIRLPPMNTCPCCNQTALVIEPDPRTSTKKEKK